MDATRRTVILGNCHRLSKVGRRDRDCFQTGRRQPELVKQHFHSYSGMSNWSELFWIYFNNLPTEKSIMTDTARGWTIPEFKLQFLGHPLNMQQFIFIIHFTKSTIYKCPPPPHTDAMSSGGATATLLGCTATGALSREVQSTARHSQSVSKYQNADFKILIRHFSKQVQHYVDEYPPKLKVLAV